MRDHGGAINYDLMTMLGTTIDAVPSVMSWRDLRDFLRHVPFSSAAFAEMNPDYAGWGRPEHTEAMIADVYDAIQALLHAYAAANSKSKPKAPRPYPRPGVRDSDTDRMGSGAIPVEDFDEWWNSKNTQGGES